MQACLPRSYLTPVRDEEAESQRKAKSRHARQTRRSTQGVTLAELKEAKKTLDSQSDGSSRYLGGAHLQKRETGDDRLSLPTLPQLTEYDSYNSQWSKDLDELGNLKTSVRLKTEASPTRVSLAAFQHVSDTDNIASGGIALRDENENPMSTTDLPNAAQETADIYTTVQVCYQTAKHERASRSDSSGGEGATDRLLSRTTSYTRRENRLASLNKADDDFGNKDYRKLYEDALSENEKLKSRLSDSKQELVKIRNQLQKVTQKQDRISERSGVYESEKREKQALEKKVSDMEEELKALPAVAQVHAMRRSNERLLAENRAMLRVLARLSEMADLPETEDL